MPLGDATIQWYRAAPLEGAFINMVPLAVPLGSAIVLMLLRYKLLCLNLKVYHKDWKHLQCVITTAGEAVF